MVEVAQSQNLLSSRYGMSLFQLTDKILEDVLAIYDDTVGAHALDAFESWGINLKSRYPKTSLDSANAVAWELGSRLSPHSRLEVREALPADPESAQGGKLIRFAFDPKLDGESSAQDSSISSSFYQRVDSYLQKMGLAVPLR